MSGVKEDMLVELVIKGGGKPVDLTRDVYTRVQLASWGGKGGVAGREAAAGAANVRGGRDDKVRECERAVALHHSPLFFCSFPSSYPHKTHNTTMVLSLGLSALLCQFVGIAYPT